MVKSGAVKLQQLAATADVLGLIVVVGGIVSVLAAPRWAPDVAKITT